jgi:hypothetical protein
VADGQNRNLPQTGSKFIISAKLVLHISRVGGLCACVGGPHMVVIKSNSTSPKRKMTSGPHPGWCAGRIKIRADCSAQSDSRRRRYGLVQFALPFGGWTGVDKSGSFDHYYSLHDSSRLARVAPSSCLRWLLPVPAPVSRKPGAAAKYGQNLRKEHPLRAWRGKAKWGGKRPGRRDREGQNIIAFDPLSRPSTRRYRHRYPLGERCGSTHLMCVSLMYQCGPAIQVCLYQSPV